MDCRGRQHASYHGVTADRAISEALSRLHHLHCMVPSVDVGWIEPHDQQRDVVGIVFVSSAITWHSDVLLE